jgi:site-specific recombinase XerD
MTLRLLQVLVKYIQVAFRLYLQKKYSEATTATMIKHSRQVFTLARRRKLVTDNPFETVKTGSQRNTTPRKKVQKRWQNTPESSAVGLSQKKRNCLKSFYFNYLQQDAV